MAKEKSPRKYSLFLLIFLLVLGLVVGIVIGYTVGTKHAYKKVFRELEKWDWDFQSKRDKKWECKALTITSPKKNAHIASPFTVTAVVDNTNPKCRWTVFEANAGSMEVQDANGQVIGNGILTTTEDWMTEQPVTYTGEMTFTQTPQSGSLTLVVNESDPSGHSSQQITYPLQY